MISIWTRIYKSGAKKDINLPAYPLRQMSVVWNVYVAAKTAFLLIALGCDGGDRQTAVSGLHVSPSLLFSFQFVKHVTQLLPFHPRPSQSPQSSFIDSSH